MNSDAIEMTELLATADDFHRWSSTCASIINHTLTSQSRFDEVKAKLDQSYEALMQKTLLIQRQMLLRLEKSE